MNTWIKATRKRVKCLECSQFIEVGEYQVVCQYFMKLKHSSKTWTKKMHFHAENPYCWVERAKTALRLKPQVETRGRRPDALADAAKEMRQRILRRRASVMQRINAEWDNGRRMDKLAHLADLMERLKVEIEPYGGVPKSW